MGLKFEWDNNKARFNLSKQAISFEEASTVFGDLNSITITDPEHSLAEDRYLILGQSYRGKLLVVVPPNEVRISELSVHGGQIERKHELMKRIAKSQGDMLPDYDFSKGLRGKYAKRYGKGSNVVVLDPDVAKIFGDSKSVNRSLRSLAKTLK